MSVQRFLDWFEGFSDNLAGPPDAGQWDKIKSRILALRDCPEPVASSSASVPAPSGPAGGEVTTARHKAMVLKALMDGEKLSLDRETAQRELAAFPFTSAHLNMVPSEVAALILSRMPG